MNSIRSQVTQSLIIQKSEFIGILVPLQSKQEIVTKLEQVKQQYPNATHYCYAYIYDQKKYCSDDGEPSGTAGMPILNVLEKRSLNHILCIVVRYFGGIKLGAGGLVRAYTKASTQVLMQAELTEIRKGYRIQCTFPYLHTKQINYLLKTATIVTKQFTEVVTYQFTIDTTQWEQIAEALNSLCNQCRIINELWLPISQNKTEK